MVRARAVALLALAALRAGAATGATDGGAGAAGACPGEAGIRQSLGVSGSGWQVACTPEMTGGPALAALSWPHARGEAPRLIVEVDGERPARFDVALVGDEGDRIRALHAESWQLKVAPARIPGVDWLRVEAIGEGGEDYAFAQSVVWFFRRERDRLVEEWAGLGDRTEIRFDACRVETRAEFSLAPDGRLVRERRSRASFSNPGSVAVNGELSQLKRKCVAAEPTRDVFPVVKGD
jgi:hypothetical protein